MQNKTIYAATGMTAAEIVYRRADAGKTDMGLTSYKGSRVRKSDIGIAKNYLYPKEIDTLNRITVMFLDMAEFRAERRTNIRMADWNGFLTKFLVDNELPTLEGHGTITRESGERRAEDQYVLFSQERRKQDEEMIDARFVADLEETVRLLDSTQKK
jgi:hypothetical protein